MQSWKDSLNARLVRVVRHDDARPILLRLAADLPPVVVDVEDVSPAGGDRADIADFGGGVCCHQGDCEEYEERREEKG